MMATRLRAGLGWLCAALYLCVIWRLSSTTADFALLDTMPLRDKGIHFVEYGALCFMAVDALTYTLPVAPSWRRGVTAVWLTVCAGLLDELHQVLVFGRSGDVYDLLADTVGALSAVLLYFVLRSLVLRAQRRALSRP